MTVAELVAKLQTMDPEARVFVDTVESGVLEVDWAGPDRYETDDGELIEVCLMNLDPCEEAHAPKD